MQWCEQELYQLGVTTRPTASDFISPQSRAIIPQFYGPFLFRTRAHVARGDDPQLAFPSKPDSSPDSSELRAMKARLEALQAAGYKQGQEGQVQQQE
jgi:hypothetical protein